MTHRITFSISDHSLFLVISKFADNTLSTIRQSRRTPQTSFCMAATAFSLPISSGALAILVG